MLVLRPTFHFSSSSSVQVTVRTYKEEECVKVRVVNLVSSPEWRRYHDKRSDAAEQTLQRTKKFLSSAGQSQPITRIPDDGREKLMAKDV